MDHEANALPTELSQHSVASLNLHGLKSHAVLILEMNKVQHVKWCMKQTKLTSEISCPTDSCLAQLVRHWPEDLEVLVSNPTGGNFLMKFFLPFPV